MDFPFTYRVVVDGHPLAELDAQCCAIIEPDRVDGGWYPAEILIDNFVVPDTHPMHEVLMQFVLDHRPKIEERWQERRREAALEGV